MNTPDALPDECRTAVGLEEGGAVWDKEIQDALSSKKSGKSSARQPLPGRAKYGPAGYLGHRKGKCPAPSIKAEVV